MTSPTRRHFLTSTSAAAALLAVPQLVQSAPEKQSDWITLFDGKSLKGWHKNPQRIGHGTGGIWRAENKTITGEQDPPGSGNGGILLTDQTFSDFEVMIDMKPDWGVCSGFFLRSNDRGSCFQMMVDYHDAGNVGHFYGEGTGGWNTRTYDIDGVYEGTGDARKLVKLKTSKHKTAEDVGLVYSCKPEEWLEAWKLNDWNTAKVRVTGKYPYITSWINGLKVAEFDGGKSNARGYDMERVANGLGPKGSIAVQVHGGKGWPNGAKCAWKNIKIRPL